MAIIAPMLITFKPGKVMAFPEIKPLSLPNAMKLPVNVRAPINILSPIDTNPVVSKLNISGFRANSPHATSAEGSAAKTIEYRCNEFRHGGHLHFFGK